MLTQYGIEANLEKIDALQIMESLRNMHEVQILAGRVVALGRFVAWLADRCLPFFKILRKAGQV